MAGQEFAKASSYPAAPDVSFSREPWLPRPNAEAYAIVIDPDGKIAWGRRDIGGEPIVVLLTEKVGNAHLAGLRDDGVGYLFAGSDTFDLPLALEVIGRELGVDLLLLEGGGGINGSVLRAGLIDEVSLVLEPAIDGSTSGPSVFDGGRPGEGIPRLAGLTLIGCTKLEGDVLWLRYVIKNG